MKIINRHGTYETTYKEIHTFLLMLQVAFDKKVEAKSCHYFLCNLCKEFDVRTTDIIRHIILYNFNVLNKRYNGIHKHCRIDKNYVNALVYDMAKSPVWSRGNVVDRRKGLEFLIRKYKRLSKTE